MKILMINSYYYPDIYGGAEISVQKLAEKLAVNNEVYVLCSGEYKKDECINNVKIIRIKYDNKIIRSSKILNNYNVLIFKKVKKIFNTMKPNVIHTNNLYNFSYIIWGIAFKMKIPIVHTVRDLEILKVKWYAKKILSLLRKYMSEKVTVVTAPSRFILDNVMDNKLFKFSSKQEVIYNSIDFSKDILSNIIRERKKKLLVQTSFNFAFVGRYEDYKGVLWLIEIFRKISTSNCQLHFFGQGSLEKKIKEITKNDKGIFINNFLNQEELYKELRNIDIIIVPSLCEEAFGRSILDAYVNGIPVIVTNKGGMPEIVNNNKTGKIIENDNTSLKNAIEFYCNADNILQSLEQIEVFVDKFALEYQVEKFIQIYTAII